MMFNSWNGGHGGRVVTLSPPTSEAGVRFPAWPQVGKLVVACHWSAVYSTEPWQTICTGFLCPSNYPSWYDLYSVKRDIKPQINKLIAETFFVITTSVTYQNLFMYLGFYVAFNTIQVISRRVVGRAEETSTFGSSGFCTVNCQLMASNYQLSHLRLCRELNPDLRGGRQEYYHSATVAPVTYQKQWKCPQWPNEQMMKLWWWSGSPSWTKQFIACLS